MCRQCRDMCIDMCIDMCVDIFIKKKPGAVNVKGSYVRVDICIAMCG